ncbi:MAG: hypothetical protein AAGJ46_11130 [Planctomycetota bacterium]
MDLHQQQQFAFLMQTAAERYALRLQERFRGASEGLDQLRANPEGEGVALPSFVDAIFEDFLLNNAAGACFVLQSLPKRRPPEVTAETVEESLVAMAKRLFRDLLLDKTLETLEQHASYEPV